MTITLINGCVFFPHRFAWRSRPEGARNWQTEIDVSLPGQETRQSLRAVSRRSITVEIFARDSERVRLESRVDAAKKSGLACIPLFGRGSYLTAPADAGANQLNVTTDAWHWQAGDYAALISDDQTFDVAAVTNVAGGTLTLAANLTFNWPQDQRYPVRPVLFGKFSAEKQTVITGRAAGWKITVAELTSARSIQIGVTPAALPGVGKQVIGKTNRL